MATVKSLEERLDGLAEELESLRTQLTTLTAKLDLLATTVSATQAQLAGLSAQLAVVTAKLEHLTEQLKATNLRIDGVTGKLETMTADYSAFKAKAENNFAFVKWVGAFVAGVFLTVLLGALAVARTAGSFETTLQQQQKTLEEIKRDIGELRGKPKP